MTTSVILAAGASSRMGRCKAMLPFGSKTALATLVDTHRAAGVASVVVVVGNPDASLQSHLRTLDVRVVTNPSPERGMFHSVVAGVQALPSDQAVFIQPVDIPLVDVDTLLALRRTTCGVALPAYRGRPGHPPLIHPDSRPSLLRWNGDDGLRGWIATCPDRVSVPVTNTGILHDMDEPADYASLVEQYERRSF